MRNLLSISSISSNAEGQFDAQVVVDENHEILKAHFPDFPIVPGACLIDCAKDIVEAYFTSAYRLVCVKNVKFLQIVNPKKNNSLKYSCNYQIEGDELKVSYAVTAKDEVISKLSLVYTQA